MNYTAAEAAAASAFANQPAINRRAHDRVPLRTTVTLTLPDKTIVQARTFDIAKGGMGVITENALARGIRTSAKFRIQTSVLDAMAVSINGQIMNVVLCPKQGGFRVGIQFLGLDAAMHDLLDKFIAQEMTRIKAPIVHF